MIKGKALLVIDRLQARNPKEFHWDIHVMVQSLSCEDPGDEVNEMFGCMEYDIVRAPKSAYNMEVGDRLRVLVSFEIHYSCDYWGEHDAQLYLLRERVLRYQPYKYKKYPPKQRNY